MEEEIEAFLSVYFDNAVCEMQSDGAAKLSIVARPEGVTTATCFVEAHMEIILPPDYPNIMPSFHISRTSGFNDEGRSLHQAVMNFLEQQSESDLILFQLMECVVACLDAANNGQCMICLDSLLPEGNGSKEVVSLRTDCYHCFHISCLCHWAAVYVSAERAKKAESDDQIDQRQLRSLQGDMRSYTMQVEKIDSEIDILQRNIAEIEMNISAQEGCATADIEGGDNVKLDKLKMLLSQLSTTLSRPSKGGGVSGKKKTKLLEEMQTVRTQIVQLEDKMRVTPPATTHPGSSLIMSSSTTASNIGIMGGYANTTTTPATALTYSDRKEIRREEKQDESSTEHHQAMSVVQLTSRQRELQLIKEQCLGRRKRMTDRIEATERALRYEEQRMQASSSILANQMDSFPCPTCRSTLTDCLPGHRDLFQQEMRDALEAYGNPATLTKPANTNGHSGDDSTTYVPDTHVSTLSKELQHIVRSIQQKQSALKTSLRSHMSSEVVESGTTLSANHASMSSVPPAAASSALEWYAHVGKGAINSGDYDITSECVVDQSLHGMAEKEKRERIRAAPSLDSTMLTSNNKHSVGSATMSPAVNAVGNVSSLKRVSGGATSRGGTVNRLQHHQFAVSSPSTTAPTALSDHVNIHLQKQATASTAQSDEEDWEVQEAIRLSLLVSQQSEDAHTQTNTHLRQTTTVSVCDSQQQRRRRNTHTDREQHPSQSDDSQLKSGRKKIISLASQPTCLSSATARLACAAGAPRTSKGGTSTTSVSSRAEKNSVQTAILSSDMGHAIVEGTEDTAEMAVNCLLCDEEFNNDEVLCCFGRCNHACICGVCSYRSRALHDDLTCPMCRQFLDVVVCTPIMDDLPTHHTATAMATGGCQKRVGLSFEIVLQQVGSCRATGIDSSSATSAPSANRKGSKLIFNEQAKMYAPKAYMNSVLRRLNEFRCPPCGKVFSAADDIRIIRRHLTDAHGLSLCDICLSARKVFRSELKVYTSLELAAHNDRGDQDSAQRGHPECHMCSRRFYDSDILSSHQTDDHHICFVCESMGVNPPAFYNNTKDLHEHFRKSHFLCKICKKLRVVAVFASASALEEHNARLHGGHIVGGGPRYPV